MDVNTALLSIKDKISDKGLMILSEKLEKTSEEKLNSLLLINFKSPIIGLILGFFLGGFGVDRFYKGDIGLGIGKLALCILGVATSFIAIGGFFILILWIWWFVDLFLVFKGIKEDNLKKVFMAID